MPSSLFDILQYNFAKSYPVIKISNTDKILALDLSEKNLKLTLETITDTETFSKFIDQTLADVDCRYGIGGYNELRNLYARSDVFNGEEPRRLHLGVDIWGPVDTPVFTPLAGHIHSFAFNDSFGDYGATIILQHRLEGQIFHTLYGHLSLASLTGKKEGNEIAAGEEIAAFGPPAENGNWPPHLHFQIIENMEGLTGDYPGVCRYSEREKYLQNCPNANVFLGNLHRQLVY